MIVNVHAPGLAEDVVVCYEQEAIDMLTSAGYVRREKQPGEEWVQFREDGNRFASVVRPDTTLWSR